VKWSNKGRYIQRREDGQKRLGNVPKIYNFLDFAFSLKTLPCYFNLEVHNGVSYYCSNPVTG
jgi:hypothetical protein